MPKAIYLFKEHENFQVGKTKLQKGAVFGLKFEWIAFGGIISLISLILIGIGSNSFRLKWLYDIEGVQTNGIVNQCKEVNSSRGGNFSYVVYSYTVDRNIYQAEDRLDDHVCHIYQANNQFRVYYLRHSPDISGIGKFLHEIDWRESYGFGAMGLINLLAILYETFRSFRHRFIKYMRLKNSGMVLKATVTDVIWINGSESVFAKCH